jgi:type IV pilus assembly protein PilQ
MTISTLTFAAFLASAQLVSIDARDIDLSDFFRFMADAAKVNIVIHPAVQGKVNLTVRDAPWEQLLGLVMKNYGLGKEVEGNVMRIAPIAAFEAEYKQRAATEQARLDALPLHTQIYFLNYAKADDVALVLSRMLSTRGSVIAYRPRNALIVRDVILPPELTR